MQSNNPKLMYTLITLLLSFGCSPHLIKKSADSPTLTVIKKISAELSGSEEAKMYIDVESVYKRKGARVESADSSYNSKLSFYANLKPGGVVGNKPEFHKYNYYEVIRGKSATVIMRDHDPSAGVPKITYSLEFRYDRWIIIGIDYEIATRKE